MNVYVNVFIRTCFHFSWYTLGYTGWILWYINSKLFKKLPSLLNWQHTVFLFVWLGFFFFFHFHNQLLRAPVWELSHKSMFTSHCYSVFVVILYYIAILMDVKWYSVVVNSVCVMCCVSTSQVLGLLISWPLMWYWRLNPELCAC